jgi:hypothetical protein
LLWPLAFTSTKIFTRHSTLSTHFPVGAISLCILYAGAMHQAGDLLTIKPSMEATSETAPTFLVQAEDDPAHVENSIDYFFSLKRAKVPAELHIYTRGGHGFGLRATALPISHWPSIAEAWLQTIHMLPEQHRWRPQTAAVMNYFEPTQTRTLIDPWAQVCAGYPSVTITNASIAKLHFMWKLFIVPVCALLLC